MSSIPARQGLRRGSSRHPPAQRVSQHLLDETVLAPSEENGHGVGSPDMIKLAQATVARTAGVLRTGGHVINASRASVSAASAGGAFGTGGHVIEAQPRYSGAPASASVPTASSAASSSTYAAAAHAPAAAGVFGAGEAIFDASRALAVLESLAQTSDAELSAGAMMDRLNEKVAELRTLRTSTAEQALAEQKAAAAARDAAADDGAAALREELEETRRRLKDAEKALHKLRTSPPPPSDAAVERHPLFVAEADARERAERRLESSERRLKSAELAKKALLAAATSTGSRRRGKAAGAAGAGGDASAAAVAAVSAELEAAEARASDAESFLSVLLGMEVERTDDDGRWWSVVLPVEDEAVELEVELVSGADSEADDEDDEDDEDAIREVCVRPVSGQHLLPPSMQETFSFGAEDGPRFLVRLLTHFVGEVVTEPVEDEAEGAAAAPQEAASSSSSSGSKRG
ncbi:hypothetical protein FNF27_05989 [Cafeteria roenbergensis]|uniref:Uncharacterized protein n=1 Tax=Cafeteria roenbergensis TaxID=33653 RepID=A0A5A8E631_CAFRO|nr:hypothetical protein FNF27_05989 [Cafeteria roenbergensis]